MLPEFGCFDVRAIKATGKYLQGQKRNAEETMQPILTAEQTADLKRVNAEARKIARGIEASFQQIAAAMIPVLRAAGQKLDAAVKQDYAAAGAPYGDTNEGCYRWAHELLEDSNEQRAEINARQREQDLADMRALGEQVDKQLKEGARQTNGRILAD